MVLAAAQDGQPAQPPYPGASRYACCLIPRSQDHAIPDSVILKTQRYGIVTVIRLDHRRRGVSVPYDTVAVTMR